MDSRWLLRPQVSASKKQGFTLLELMIAFAILALYILPVLHLVHEARIRSTRTSLTREVQNLSQQKLFERIYFYSEETVLAGSMEPMSGNFAEQGRPKWDWEIPYPQLVNQGEQVLLQYTIRVFVPQLGEQNISVGSSESGGSGMSLGYSGGTGNSSSGDYGGYGGYGGYGPPMDTEFSDRTANFEMTTWSFPSEFWYDEQSEMQAMGLDTGFYGNEGYGGGYGQGSYGEGSYGQQGGYNRGGY